MAMIMKIGEGQYVNLDFVVNVVDREGVLEFFLVTPGESIVVRGEEREKVLGVLSKISNDVELR